MRYDAWLKSDPKIMEMVIRFSEEILHEKNEKINALMNVLEGSSLIKLVLIKFMVLSALI